MTTLEVCTGDGDLPVLVGQAHLTRGRRGEVSTTFVYDPRYLAADGANIDPSLVLGPGAQHRSGLLAAFADSAPDRWGRNLLVKAERQRARRENRPPRALDEVDHLLGVSDDTRQGALRFRRAGSTELLGEPSTVPPLVSLPRLLRASDDLAADADSTEALKQLLDTGTTGLGGARPKASVRWHDGHLGIAKFPHPGDRWDVIAWEATALDLLEAAGIRTPGRRLTRVGDRSVLVLRRFDRGGSGGRIGYISAMTALGARDGDHRDYVELADAVRDLSPSPRQDQEELFDRAVAGVALGNTDDHLRNHGFLQARGGWALSPVFDVNPNPDPTARRATSIAGAEAPPDEVDGLLALAGDCGLSAEQARDRMARVAAALRPWREKARRNGLPDRQIALMAEGIEPRLRAVGTAAR